jgi:hypothetical protein
MRNLGPWTILALLAIACAPAAAAREDTGAGGWRDGRSDGTYTRDDADITCEVGGVKVVFAQKAFVATYFQDGQRVGSSDCGTTRMSTFDVECRRDPTFAFLFASIPGPSILQGKSAQVTDAKGNATLLDCRRGDARSISTAAALQQPPLACAPGQTACGAACCAPGQQCSPSPISATSPPYCLQTSISPGDGGALVPIAPLVQ